MNFTFVLSCPIFLGSDNEPPRDRDVEVSTQVTGRRSRARGNQTRKNSKPHNEGDAEYEDIGHNTMF